MGLLKNCNTEGVRNYDQKLTSGLDIDAAWNSVGFGIWNICCYREDMRNSVKPV